MGATYIWAAQTEWDWIDEVKPGQCVYDIGANCGQSTLHVAHAVGPAGAVIAFEPVPENFQRLERNIKLNGLSSVTPICAAASDREGVTSFEFDPSRPTLGRLQDGGSLQVRLIALDAWATHGWPAPHFMKIDVEGGGAGVLAGADALIGDHRPTIYLETHNAQEHQAAKDLLDRHRYRAHSMDGRQVTDPTSDSASPLILRPWA
jgi:FkbM family methyltransferase